MQSQEVIQQNPIILKVTDHDENGKTYDMWTATDGRGHYHLTNGKEVWFTDSPDNEILHEPVQPIKPKIGEADYAVYSINGRFGVYDARTFEKYADVSDADDGWNTIFDMQHNDADDMADHDDPAWGRR